MRGALAEAQSTFAAIPLALDRVTPAPAIKQRLMGRIGSARPDPSAMKPAKVSGDELPDSLPIRIFRTLVPAAVAAGIAVIITHATVTARLKPQLIQGQAAERMLTVQEQRLDELVGTLKEQKRYVEMLRAPNLKLVQLDGGTAQPEAVARILWDQKSNQWLLLTSGVAPQPPNKTYELWYITPDQKKIAAGTFNVDTRGEGMLFTTIPPSVGPIAIAAVTDEPAGGVSAPTGSIQLVAKLQ